MKKIVWMIILFGLVGCASQEVLMMRQMKIQDVDMSSVMDGAHVGSYSHSGFEYRIQAVVRDHTITDIIILNNRDTKYARKAEEVAAEIIKEQTPNVDAVSGATTTSKALMKAVENALLGNMTM